MKTPLSCFLVTIAAASTVMAADLQRPTAGTRKQAQDAGDRPYVSEEGSLFGRIFGRPDSTRANRKQLQTEGRPAIRGTYDATTRANVAEDRNRETVVKGDATDGDQVPGR
jgi:hypothetical protein